jgi:hypothetical protein
VRTGIQRGCIHGLPLLWESPDSVEGPQNEGQMSSCFCRKGSFHVTLTHASEKAAVKVDTGLFAVVGLSSFLCFFQ